VAHRAVNAATRTFPDSIVSKPFRVLMRNSVLIGALLA
jgi:hypothetical protein